MPRRQPAAPWSSPWLCSKGVLMRPKPSPPRSSTRAFRSRRGARIRNRPSGARHSRRRLPLHRGSCRWCAAEMPGASGGNGPGESEPDMVVPADRRDVVAARRAHVSWIALPRTAADDAGNAILGCNRAAVLRRPLVVPDIAILDPFRDIAEDVVEPPRVGFERSDWGGINGAIIAARDDRIRRSFLQCQIRHVLVSAAILCEVPPVACRRYAGARCIFPFRFTRQSVMVSAKKIHQ